MKALIVLGIVLILLGGGLMVKGFLTVEDKHEVDFLGAKVSVTEKDRRQIPPLVTGTLLAVGAALTVIGAVRLESR